jgi:hypothetical protein
MERAVEQAVSGRCWGQKPHYHGLREIWFGYKGLYAEGLVLNVVVLRVI